MLTVVNSFVVCGGYFSLLLGGAGFSLVRRVY